MPTRVGNLFAQFVGQSFVTQGSHSLSIHPNNRDITAYSGISQASFFHSDGNVDPITSFSSGIDMVISNGVDEHFQPQASILRNNVTKIRFSIQAVTVVGKNPHIRAHHVINYWN